jgi:hypothetical protein
MDGFGKPVYGYLEIPFHQSMIFLRSIFGNEAQVLFLTIPVLSAFALTYFGLNRLKLGTPTISLLGAFAMAMGPLVTLRIWNVPITASFGTLVFGALVLYLVCLLIGPEPFRMWRVAVPLLALWPFYLLAFTNPYYAMGAAIPLVLLALYLLFDRLLSVYRKDGRHTGPRIGYPEIFTLGLILIMILLLVLVPLISTGIGGTRISSISQNQISLIEYVKQESQTPFAITLLNFDPSVENLSGWGRLLLSTFLLSLALLPLLELKRLPEQLRRAYLLFLGVLIIGWTLEKGIQEPFSQINEAFYSLMGSLAIGFRSPSSKFSILQGIALAPLVSIGLSRIWYATQPLGRRPLFRTRINLKYLAVGSLVLVLVGYTVTDPLVNGDIGNNQVMKQPKDLISQHLQKINDLIKPYGEGRLLLLPLDTDIWSAYRLDNSSDGYQYLGPNEYMAIGTPTLTHYESGLNDFLSLLLAEQNPSGIRALIQLGNINTIVLDLQKIDPAGHFPAVSQKAWLETLKSALGKDLEQIPSDWPFTAYHITLPTSYCYAAKERLGVNESIGLIGSIADGNLTLSSKSPGVGNITGAGNVSIPFRADSSNLSASVVWNFTDPIQITDIPDILTSMNVPDSVNVSGIVIDLLSANGSGYSWVVPKPYPFQDLRLGADSAFMSNGIETNVTAVKQIRITINTISQKVEDFGFEVVRLDIVPSTRLTLEPIIVDWVDSDHWTLHLANASTGLVLFSQSYDQHWTAISGNSSSPEPYGELNLNLFRGAFGGDFQINYVEPNKIPSYQAGMSIFLAILLTALAGDILWWVWRRHRVEKNDST